jgi:multicomponent Na+:H+ antiporter subunit E
MVAAARFAAFLSLWLLLDGGGLAGFACGLVAATLATRASLALSPPRDTTLSPMAALRLAAAVGRATVAAGVDVARRVLDPVLPIRPGVVAVPLALPPGTARDGFRLLASLQPGTLPAGIDGEGRLLVHALDTALPVGAETKSAEALFATAAGVPRHG